MRSRAAWLSHCRRLQRLPRSRPGFPQQAPHFPTSLCQAFLPGYSQSRLASPSAAAWHDNNNMNPRLLSDAPAVKTYDVGGVLLERPFKIRRLGHFGFNVEHLDEAAHFYVDLLGFMISDEARNGGLFTRYGSDHHAFVLFPRRQESSGEVTINQITWQVGSLREVGDAVDFFADQGVQVGRVGRDTPGSNWHVYPFYNDGHTTE